jgi:hypothetical protein
MMQIDQVRAVHPHKIPGVEPGFDVAQSLRLEVASAASMQCDVIVLSFDKLDGGYLDHNNLLTVANEYPLQRGCVSLQQGIQRRFRLVGQSPCAVDRQIKALL